MCWSATASITATALGYGATALAAKKGFPKIQTFTLGFFATMELLQALSYIWIGQCGITGNTLLTYLSYLHISIQPAVMSAFMLSFMAKEKRLKWQKVVMAVGIISSLLLATRMFVPMLITVPAQFMCSAGDAMCGTDVCTYRGNWHLAWRLPLLDLSAYLLYFLPVFILPIFYGAWRVSLYHFLFGPLLAHLLTTDVNEAPAIWCLFSIVLLSVIFVKPVKSKLLNKKHID